MKIITKCVIDIKTSKVIEEESFDYIGPLALCSGGGSSGASSWPEYLQNSHASMLSHGTGGTQISTDIMQTMNAMYDNSPWIGFDAYNPDVIMGESVAAVAVFASLLSGIDELTDWSRFYSLAKSTLAVPPDGLVVEDLEVDDVDVTGISDLAIDDMTAIDDLVVADAAGVTDAEIILDVDAFADQLDDEILTKVLPRFKRGMQDINAVVSSAFVIGSSNIEGFRDRDVAKHNSVLRVNAAMKNADVDVSNMNKDVQVGLGNINKDIDSAKVDILKDVDVGKTNIGKDIKIAETNVNKDMQVGIANLRKDTQVGEINIKSAVEYERMYLEGASQMMQIYGQKISANDSLGRMTVDSNRIRIVGYKEWKDMENTIAVSDALWNIELFQYGANLLAAISGGTMGNVTEKPSAAISAIGGALGGASAGAQIGANTGGGGYGAAYGAAIGAVLGAAGGLISRNNS